MNKKNSENANTSTSVIFYRMQGQGQGNWGNPQQQGGWNQGGNMNMGGNMGHQQNPFMTPNQNWGQGGFHQQPQWQNQNHIQVPPIQFNGGCKKCHGTGKMNRKGQPIPCRTATGRKKFVQSAMVEE